MEPPRLVVAKSNQGTERLPSICGLSAHALACLSQERMSQDGAAPTAGYAVPSLRTGSGEPYGAYWSEGDTDKSSWKNESSLSPLILWVHPMPSRLTTFVITMLFLATAHAGCRTQNILGAATPKERKLLEAFGEGWLMNAKVCRVGSYRVAVPHRRAGPDDRRIMVFLGQKPLLWRMEGDTLLFDPNSDHADLSHPIVNVWDGKSGKDVARLWYQTVPTKDGRYVSVYDINFDGQPDTRIMWKGTKILKAFAWYHHEWRKMGKRCIVISGRCVPARFTGGKWRVQK